MGFSLQLGVFFLLFSPNLALACMDGNCRTLAFPAPFFFADKRLVNHTIRNEDGVDFDICQFHCYQEYNCVSINYELSTQICELNNATHRGHDNEFVDKSGYLYHGADSACDEIQCKNNGTCQSGFTDKLYRCLCLPGFIGEQCENDDDECMYSPSVCDANANCQDTFGSYTCSCKVGFSGDGKTCTDDDECKASHFVCDANANCENIVGSYICSCKVGFSGDGETCTDIDECTQGPNDCLQDNAYCRNTDGSYTCTCNHGYVGDGKTSCVFTPECQNYQSLSSADRKTTYRGGTKCDSGLSPGWFRIEGSAGSRMATSCPRMHRCDTAAPGWMNGAHPTVDDRQVSRTVCFPKSSRKCCEWQTTIKVINCGSYYVYYLSGTPHCYLRYCGID